MSGVRSRINEFTNLGKSYLYLYQLSNPDSEPSAVQSSEQILAGVQGREQGQPSLIQVMPIKPY